MHEHKSISIVLNRTWGTTNLTERDMLDFSPVSAGPWEHLSKTILFPEDVNGLRILDIGGGASEATSRLIEMGADAYSIDPKYKSVPDIRKSLTQILQQ